MAVKCICPFARNVDGFSASQASADSHRSLDMEGSTNELRNQAEIKLNKTETDIVAAIRAERFRLAEYLSFCVDFSKSSSHLSQSENDAMHVRC